MGETTLPSGLVVPDFLDSGANWWPVFNQGLINHGVWRGHRDPDVPLPTLWCDAMGAGLDPGDPGYSALLAGAEDHPFRTPVAAEAYAIAAGWNGVLIKSRRGPWRKFGTPPYGGGVPWDAGEPNGGQAYLFTAPWQPLDGTHFEGCGGFTKEINNDGIPRYNCLFYGPIPPLDGGGHMQGVLHVGSRTGSPSTQTGAVDKVCVTNNHPDDTGHGIGWQKQIGGTGHEDLAAFGSGGHGNFIGKAGADGLQTHRLKGFQNGKGPNGGFGFYAGSVLGSPNRISMYDMHLRDNGNFDDSVSGEFRWEWAADTSGGFACLFAGARMGPNGIYHMGSREQLWLVTYIETSSTTGMIEEPLIFDTDPSGDGTDPWWSSRIYYLGGYFHGWNTDADIPLNVARHFRVKKGKNIRIDMLHFFGMATTLSGSKPVGWFDDDNSRDCVASFPAGSVTNGAGADLACGVAGAGYCHRGHHTNKVDYWDKDA